MRNWCESPFFLKLLRYIVTVSEDKSCTGFRMAFSTNRIQPEFWWLRFSICGKTLRKYVDV